MKIERLTDATFERVIHQAQRPILVTFSAPKRCAACRQQKPALELLAAEGYPVFVLDVEQPDSSYVAKTFGGKGVPFHKVYARGKLLVEHLDLLKAEDLVGLLAQANQMQMPKRGGYASVGGFLCGFGRGGEPT